MLQQFFNGKLVWSSESAFSDIVDVVPMEIMKQKNFKNGGNALKNQKDEEKVKDDEILAYQAPYWTQRVFYRFKIHIQAHIKFFTDLKNHFGLQKQFNVHKNQHQSSILVVVTKSGYIYGVYLKCE